MPKKKPSVVLTIRLDENTLKAVDLLVESGLESNRSRAVSHFVNIGIQASEALLHKARTVADSLKELRNEMIEAVKVNNVQKVNELLERDAGLVNATNNKGETAVLMAAYYQANEIKELLLNKGAELSIFEASAIGSTSRTKEWLANNPELVHSYSADGFTPLALAAHFGNEETVKLLLQNGADVNARGKDGNLNNMPIHAAIAGNYEHVVRLLISHHADIHAKCEGKWRPGYTPLHVAAFFGRSSIAKLLLHHGADKKAETADGQTAYSLAVSRGHPETAELLI